jgi:hypothetical protein
METKAKLGAKAIGRRELENNEGYELKEPQPVGSSCPVVARRAKSEAESEDQSPYNRVFDPEKCSLRLKNDHIWKVS